MVRVGFIFSGKLSKNWGVSTKVIKTLYLAKYLNLYIHILLPQYYTLCHMPSILPYEVILEDTHRYHQINHGSHPGGGKCDLLQEKRIL